MRDVTQATGIQEADRPLRRDAQRNRALILQTAAQVFAEQGLDASYDEIARRAHIGVGTVYRRFPERAELVRALFESRIEGMVASAEEAARRPDAWEGLTWFVERALEQQVADRGLKEVMVGTVSEDERRAIGRDRLGPLIERMVTRARADGTLREDVGAADVGMVLMLLSSVSTPADPGLWRRYLAILLDGLRARPDQQSLPLAAPTDEALHDLVRHLHGRSAG